MDRCSIQPSALKHHFNSFRYQTPRAEGIKNNRCMRMEIFWLGLKPFFVSRLHSVTYEIINKKIAYILGVGWERVLKCKPPSV